MRRNYCFSVHDVEHEGDYEPFATAIRNGGGEITRIDWSEEDGDDADIHFVASPNQLQAIRENINELLIF